jgi:hypothetical protein
MTDNAVKPIKWAGGEHGFTLNHPWVKSYLKIRGLPGENGSSPAACWSRFEQANYTPDDIERVIYLGLIGAGLTMREADDLIERHVEDRPVLENGSTASWILASLFVENAGTELEVA